MHRGAAGGYRSGGIWCGGVAGSGGFALAEYVNDRPYAASSFMSVALVTVFKSAMAGTCKGHEELAGSPIPLEAWLPVVPARGGEDEVRRLFEPLGYAVEVEPIAARSGPSGLGCKPIRRAAAVGQLPAG